MSGSEHLTPTQVARAIGVSPASLKRWCDKGLIPSVRTEGGHRRLPLRGVIGFLRETGRSLVRPEILRLPPTTGSGRTVLSRAVPQLVSALLAGDDAQVHRTLFDLYLAGQSVVRICDNIVTPAFAEIGRRWQTRQARIYQERRACELCNCVLRRLAFALPETDTNAPLAVGGAPAGDPYVLPTTMVTLVMRSLGWRAENLGTDLPVDTLIEAIADLHPRLVWLSVSAEPDIDALRVAYPQLYAAARQARAALVVGGRFLNDSVRAALPHATCCDTLAQLVSLVRSG